MIKFIDLETGAMYDGSWNIDDDTRAEGGCGYIHKFDDQQSVNLIYTKKLCLICDKPILSFEIEDNPIFSLLNIPSVDPEIVYNENIYGTEYVNLKDLKTSKIINQPGFEILSNLYLYVLYFTGLSFTPGEFICLFYVHDADVIHICKLGADFYTDNEINKINLANFGVEIPDLIDKSIYVTNVHEDKIDHLTLNRKWKELLSNFWDVYANKGSYKSLINSLKWFEYGDLIKIKELWKNSDFDKTFYSECELQSTIVDKYETFLITHHKTTYISLQLALNKIKKDKYDSELNPEIEKISALWSIQDLMLKMNLLGNFFETYFMPIHLNLISSTVENIVFTNTIKLISTNIFKREDLVANFKTIKCNVHDGDVFYLKDVAVLVNYKTPMANQYQGQIYYSKEDYLLAIKKWQNWKPSRPGEKKPPRPEYTTYDNTVFILGVDDVISDLSPMSNFAEIDTFPEDMTTWTDELKNIYNKTQGDIKTFWTQKYNGPGAVINFDCEVCLEDEDYIKREQISLLPDDDINTLWMTKVMGDIYKERIVVEDKGTKITTKLVNAHFKLLCKEARDYDIRIQLDTASGRSFSKQFKFKVLDPVNASINIYKINRKPYENLDGFEHFLDSEINDIVFSRLYKVNLLGQTDYNPCAQFTPIYPGQFDNPRWHGVCLNSVLVLYGLYIMSGSAQAGLSRDTIRLKLYIDKHYMVFIKTIGNDEIVINLACYKKNDNIKQAFYKMNGLINPLYYKNIPNFTYYTVCISKKFWFKPDIDYIKPIMENTGEGYPAGKVIRNDYGYFPQFHYMLPFGGDKLIDNIITNDDTLCVVPDFKYSGKLPIEDYEWIFKNASTGQEMKFKNSILEPFISNDILKDLPNGYYDIIFNYKLTKTSEYKKLVWNSAFIKL